MDPTDPAPGTVDAAPPIQGLTTAEHAALQARRERLAEKAGGSLRRRTASGIIVNAAFSIGLQALSFLRGFVVAIFLAPSDYGVWAILVIGYTAIGRLKSVGIGDKYIQQDDPDEEAAFQKAFTLEAIMTGGMTLILAAATPLLALAYNAPQIIVPGLVSLLVTPAVVLQTPVWAYTREMEFKRQRMLSSIDPVVAVIVTVATAIAGLGYWSFVLGTLAGTWAGALVIMRHSPYRLRFRYDRGTAREYVTFSTPLLVSNVANSVLLQGVTVTARAFVGLAGIGAMSLTNSVRLYVEFADGIISGTMYPAVCAVKDRTDLLFESFVKSNRLAMMWGVPLGVGAALFAPDLIRFVLGHKWAFATTLFQSVGLASALAQVAFNWDDYLRAVADTKPIALYAWTGLIGWGAGPIPLMIVDGLRGYALGLFVVAVFMVGMRCYYMRRLFPQFAIGRHIGRALLPTIPATAVVLAVRVLEPFDRSLAVALAELVLYVGITVLATWSAEKTLLREAIGYLRRARAGAVQFAT
jgi:lipopolysaccharide exporter